MTELDQRRIAEWIGDAFAILCVRLGGFSEAETRVRLGFESILRQLGTPPLRALSGFPVPLSSRTGATVTDLRLIVKALDSCLAVFDRYPGVLTPAQQHIQQLVRATRQHAEEELRNRSIPQVTTTSV